jgi:hypothetical protein
MQLARSLVQVVVFACAAYAESPASFRLSGPFTHENLTVFLIHSSEKVVPSTLLPLKNAMEQKKVTVYETGNVNQLAIENTSTEAVFVQGGDIVKGGQQDRVFTMDMVLPPRSGRVPIAAFCVEQGRWTKRGAEEVKTFSASDNALPTKAAKIAVKSKGDQQEVWNSVSAMQSGVAMGAGVAPRSFGTSSAQITLESKVVVNATDPFKKALLGILDGKPDVIGVAFAINGELNTADVYHSPALFRQLWPKLLDATAVEAVAAPDATKPFPAPREENLKNALSAAHAGKESSRSVNSRTTWTKKDSDKLLMFETIDLQQGWVHRSYIVK